jgi:hypothetical protein
MQAPAGVPNLDGIEAMALEQITGALPCDAGIAAFQYYGFPDLIGEVDEQAMIAAHGRTRFGAATPAALV